MLMDMREIADRRRYSLGELQKPTHFAWAYSVQHRNLLIRYALSDDESLRRVFMLLARATLDDARAPHFDYALL